MDMRRVRTIQTGIEGKARPSPTAPSFLFSFMRDTDMNIIIR